LIMIEGMTARLILSLALFPSTACLASAGGEGSLSFYLRILRNACLGE